MMSAIVETMLKDRRYGGWLWALKLFGKSWFGWTDDTQPSPTAWRHLYDEGCTPLEALQIDLWNQ